MRNPNLEKVIGKIIGKSKKENSEIEKMKKKMEKDENRKEKENTVESITPSSTGKIYLKALPLRSLNDLEKIKNEVKSGNILIVRVDPLAEKNVEDVKRAIGELSEFVASIGGDIARLGEERIVLTPPNVQIWKKKSASSNK